VTGDAARPGGEAQACCRGEHNTAGQRSKLHLESGHNVRKPSRASIVNGMEIVGQIDQKLSAMGYTEPNSGVRSIDAPRAALSGDIDAILRLQASRWDDVAGVGHVRPICLDLALGIRTIFGGRGFDNSSPLSSEQKREHQRGPGDVDHRQLMMLPGCRCGEGSLALEGHRFTRVVGRGKRRWRELALRRGDWDWMATTERR
jgi:hypothetical protein